MADRRSGDHERVVRRGWNHALALLVVGHLFAITVTAIPTPGGDLTPRNKADPQVRATLAPWAGLVAELGLAADAEAGIDWLWTAGQVWARAHRAVTAPAGPWIRFTGHKQAWGMFGYSPAVGGALQVHGIGERGEEVLLYARGGPSWEAPMLDHHRVRRVRYEWSQGRSLIKLRALCRWLAARDHGYRAIRVSLREVRVPPAGQLRRHGLLVGDVVWEHTEPAP